MSSAQRLVFLLVAVAIAIVAFVVIGGGDEGTEPSTPAASAPAPDGEAEEAAPGPATADETPTAEPTPTPPPRPPLLTAGSGRTIRVQQGERVRFRVRHPTAEEVHVHGYDITRDLNAGETATVSFPADIAGIFEVELELSHQPLGTIEVRP